MKCSIMLHFIWVFTVFKRTLLGGSQVQRVEFEPQQDMRVFLLIAYAQKPQLNAYNDVSSTTRGL